MIRRSILIFTLFLASYINTQDSCYDVINTLSSQDKCLSSRVGVKTNVAKNSTTTSADIFVTNMKAQIVCNGTYYACGLTRGWVSEIFQGLYGQYQEFKYAEPFNNAA